MTPFFKVTLRTSDVAAARAFYARLLGDLTLDIVQLHEQAVARGARPHWLGFLDVGDVEAAAAAFVARGASPMAPKWVNPEGLEAAVMRDPGGAIVALARPPPLPASTTASPVAWQVLHTTDVQRAKANYGELFGWHFKSPQDSGDLGTLHPFSWAPDREPVGSMMDLAGRPGVHPHWLFLFGVAEMGPAVEAVRAGGGVALGPFTLPGGAQVAVCDDAQGAAFGLWQRGP
jgi:predicted enzyme related to lactoylglutathione lyase